MRMKLSICLLLGVVAASSADQGFYQQSQPAAQPVLQTAPSSYGYRDYDAPQKDGYVRHFHTHLVISREEIFRRC